LLSLAMNAGWVATPMIPRNTTIPTEDGDVLDCGRQPDLVEVHVFRVSARCRPESYAGKFTEGVPPAPRGMAQIEVTLDIDARRILNVTAKTWLRQGPEITITSSSGLSKERSGADGEEADAHSARTRPSAKNRSQNQLDSMVYQMEKMLGESGDKISGSERAEVENAIADAKRRWSRRQGELDRARETLTQVRTRCPSRCTKRPVRRARQDRSNGGAGPAQGGNGQAEKDEGVIDAEYVDVEDKK